MLCKLFASPPITYSQSMLSRNPQCGLDRQTFNISTSITFLQWQQQRGCYLLSELHLAHTRYVEQQQQQQYHHSLPDRKHTSTGYRGGHSQCDHSVRPVYRPYNPHKREKLMQDFVSVSEKKYTEEHEWIELSPDGKIGKSPPPFPPPKKTPNHH